MDKEWKVIVQGFQTTGESLVKIAAYANAKNYVAARPDIGRLTNAQHNRAVAALHNGFKECSVY
jgi:hypothetical protein